MSALLDIRQLTVTVPGETEDVTILHDVSVTVHPGECVALVGESGSGKSMTARSVLGVLPRNAEVTGQVLLDQQDILLLERKDLKRVRQRAVSMIYQDPRASINPTQRIGDFIVESVTVSKQMTRRHARHRAVELLRSVHLDNAEQLWSRYPHELSGGMLQRVMIVAALINSPSLMLCDEPTTALDVTNQAEVVAILTDLQRSVGLGMLFITHDIDLAAAIATRVYVMRQGRIVESGDAATILSSPTQRYTRALLEARPRIDGPAERLRTIDEALRGTADAP